MSPYQSTMISIKYSAVPLFLHHSSFYKSLRDDEEDGEIEILETCYKLDDTVSCVEELNLMLHIDRFWGLNHIPSTLIKYCFEMERSEWLSNVVETLCKEFAVLLELKDILLREDPLIDAIKSKCRFEIVAFLITVSDPTHKGATQAAAEVGEIRYLKLLRERGFSWDEDTCQAASKGGHLDCLIFAHENNCPWNEDAMIHAAENGHLKCLQYVHEEGVAWDDCVCGRAAQGGHLDCLKYAHQHGCPWDEVAAFLAAGHLECLRYILENGCAVDDYACSTAAEDHLDCLQLLHQYGAPWNENAPSAAAKTGSLDCLQFLYEHDCPWDENTMDNAAEMGHLECLQYAREHECPFSYYIFKLTAATGHLDCLQYLVSELGKFSEETGDVFAIALIGAHYECVKFLLSKRYPMGKVKKGVHTHPRIIYYEYFSRYNVDTVFDQRFLQCIQYACEKGYKWDDRFVKFVTESYTELPLSYAFVCA